MSEQIKTTQVSGKVKWYHPPKGYGFIAGDDGNEYYVQHSAIDMDGFRKLRRGQTVSFTAGGANHGHYVAEHVTVIAEPEWAAKKEAV